MNCDDVSDGYRDKKPGGRRSEVPVLQLPLNADDRTGIRLISVVSAPGVS